MYEPAELARFAISEFVRGIEGLTDAEARTRMKKADGTEMNAISWIIAHIAGHWLSRPERLEQFNFQSDDPTPPPLADAREWLTEGGDLTERWLPNADDALLSTKPEYLGGESIGTGVIRAVLHTWFHAGEINAIRQQLGHAEIRFVGDMLGKLEWRSEGDGNSKGYRPDELARFAISEFERGLEGVTEREARVRHRKADGTRMNGITWTIGHIASYWLFAYALMTQEPLPHLGDRLFVGAGADPTPPPLVDMRAMFADAKARTEAWLPSIDDQLLSAKRDFGPRADDNLGTQLMRGVLHTWFHTGEINAVRQTLGHSEIDFVGPMVGKLEWRSL